MQFVPIICYIKKGTHIHSVGTSSKELLTPTDVGNTFLFIKS